MKSIINDLVFFFVNYILNRIPSRTIRQSIYSFITGNKISKNASVGLGVRILNIRNVEISANSNVNFGCVLDGRGGKLVIESNVDIAPQVNIWTLQHNISSAFHESQSGNVTLCEGCWIGNRAIILPDTVIGRASVIGAGVTFKGNAESGCIIVSHRWRILERTRSLNKEFKLHSIRRFR
ncbi:acyltransferase [Plesiomonas shigelloides]|uniref:acyltransferase n=1 Tax=Plesiomonas shigelloides TaxID=703 RepID=UPI00387EF27E